MSTHRWTYANCLMCDISTEFYVVMSTSKRDSHLCLCLSVHWIEAWKWKGNMGCGSVMGTSQPPPRDSVRGALVGTVSWQLLTTCDWQHSVNSVTCPSQQLVMCLQSSLSCWKTSKVLRVNWFGLSVVWLVSQLRLSSGSEDATRLTTLQTSRSQSHYVFSQL